MVLGNGLIVGEGKDYKLDKYDYVMVLKQFYPMRQKDFCMTLEFTTKMMTKTIM